MAGDDSEGSRLIRQRRAELMSDRCILRLARVAAGGKARCNELTVCNSWQYSRPRPAEIRRQSLFDLLPLCYFFVQLLCAVACLRHKLTVE